MVTQELLNYISEQTQKGVSETDVRKSLLNNGWDLNDVDVAFGSMIHQPSTETPVANTVAPMTREEASSAIKKMGKFKASKMLFLQSLNLLKKDKEVVLFPIFSSIILMIILVVFTGVIWFSGLIEIQEDTVTISSQILFYALLFIFYVITYYTLTYFRVGLTSVVYERINGGDISFKEGMNRASKISGKILLWSLLAGTVGIVLKIISDKSKWLGKLVANFLGAAWNIVTMFIAPTLLLDNVSVLQSVKNSSVIFKKTWGETLIVNISLGLVSSIVIFITFLLFSALGFLSLTVGLGLIGIIIVGILFVLSLITISIISTSLSEIFKVALYSYARSGIIAEGFSPEFIIGAVKEEKKK